MSGLNSFALHRPDLTEPLMRGDEKLRALMGSSQRAFPARTTFVEQAAEHPYIYRLRSGWAGRTRYLPDGRRQIILIFLPDDLFGVKSLFLTSHGDAIEAISDVTVDLIHHRDLRDVYMRDADVALRCNWQVVEEERRLHNWVVSLGQGSADERLAQVLLEWHGRLVRAGVIEADSREFAMPLTQEGIAAHLGLTAVHVNRILRKFRDERLVLSRGGRIQLLDHPALRRLAHPIQDSFEREVSRDGAS